MGKIVQVAVGVIVDANGNILIARRAQDAHQGGLWEFPGGKVDPGESVQAALTRELREELAIDVEQTQALIQIAHEYTDKSVVLDVHKVTAFSGTACGNEGQPILWVAPEELANYAFPAANKAIITALTLPEKMLVTGKFISIDDFMLRLQRALGSGIKLIQLRCPDLPSTDFRQLAAQANELCQSYQAQLILNTSVENFSPALARGLHLNRHQIKKYQTRPVAESILLGASCHDQEEIGLACKLGVDYICLSPVAKTPSHPDAITLGWEKFAELTRLATVPVYALGGMQFADIDIAHRHGGQGIAGISCFWNS